MPTEVSCPNCEKNVLWSIESKFKPFCSERCKLIDLGEWADEGHKISQPIQTDVEFSEEMLDNLEEQFLQHNKFFVEPE